MKKKRKDVAIKLSTFLQITVIINKVIKSSEVQKKTTLRTHNTLAIPTLLKVVEPGH
jgi:hypothetical protein